MQNSQTEQTAPELQGDEMLVASAVDVASGQFLTFSLDGEAFATEISRVREVLEYAQITPVPRSPDYMLGVINLRGNVVPIVDLRLQFGMAVREPDIDTCIIIVEIDIEGSTTVLGVLADSVQEVIDLSREQLEAVPSLGTRVNHEFIEAMGKVDGRFVIVLDMQKVFSANQLNDVSSNLLNGEETAA